MSRREEILARLATILPDVTGVNYFLHNDLSVPSTSEKLPCVVMFDGDEQAEESSFGRKRPAIAPNIIYMTPEVYLVLENNPGDVGTSLNAIMHRIVSTVLTDDQLLGLAHDGDIRYEGLTSALSLGRSMEGEMGINLTIAYQSDFSL